jgi:hypothetical protein
MKVPKTNKWLLGTLALVGVASIATFAMADESYVDLQNRLDAAEAKIASLTAPSDLDVQRAEANEAMVREILADADARAMLQGDKNPVTVNVGGFVQTRYSYNGGGSDEANHGFSLPRARLILSGDIYSWSYKVSGQWDDVNNNFVLKDAYGQGKLFGDWTLRAGQFKTPFMREVLVNQTDTLMAERSIVSNQFGQGRSQGVQLSRDWGMFDFAGSYSDGFDTANGAGVQNGQAFTGRVGADVLSWWNVGAAVSWNDLVATSYTTYTIDTKVSKGNLDLTAAYVATSGDAGDNWGATVQAGYMCMDNFQGYVAYEYGELEGVTDNLSTFTIGANYWINENIKWTTDVGYALNGINAAWDLGETGWNSGDSGEYLIRTQLQFKF